MALSSDGGRLAVGTSEGDVVIVDARTQRPLRTFHAHSHSVRVLFLRDGTLVTSSRDGRVSLWDTKTARLIKSLAEGGALASSRDGKRIAINGPGTAFQIVEVDSGRQLAVPVNPAGDPDDFISCLALSPDGRRAAWGSWLGDVAVWDVVRATVVWSERIPGQTPIEHSAEHPNLGGPSMVGTLSFSPDGQRLALGGRDSLLIVYDALTGRRLSSDSRTGGSYAGSLYALAFLPNGRSLVAGYSFGLIRRVSVPEGREEFSVENGIDGILRIWPIPPL